MIYIHHAKFTSVNIINSRITQLIFFLNVSINIRCKLLEVSKATDKLNCSNIFVTCFPCTLHYNANVHTIFVYYEWFPYRMLLFVFYFPISYNSYSVHNYWSFVQFALAIDLILSISSSLSASIKIYSISLLNIFLKPDILCEKGQNCCLLCVRYVVYRNR